MTDSPLASRFVAAPDNWPRNGTPIRAIVIHMAEGGGTVSWLTRDDGNSSHYVVEYSGNIVQMVLEARAAGSVNPRELRTTDDAPYAYLGESVRYGVTAAKKVMGTTWSNPNAAAIAIETEGYAVTGPNLAQQRALAALVADIRKRRGPLGVLGHRDFQDYKACPGHRVPWLDYGGHTATDIPVEEEPVGININLDATHDPNPLDAFGTASIVGASHYAIRVSDGARTAIADGTVLGVVQKGVIVAPAPAWAAVGEAVVVYNLAGEATVSPLRDTGTTFKALAVPSDTTPYDQAAINAAVNAALDAVGLALTEARP
jgi:hypothetical protein